MALSPIPESIPELVPARMLNEFVYCPRLAWLEWVAGEWADSADTVDGRVAHRAVDKEEGRLSEPDNGESDDEFVAQARSVTMSAPAEQLIARMDVVEQQGSKAWPVDTKRGEMPDVPDGVWEPEQVQVCAQVLILRENGYASDRGFVYFAGSRRRVEVYASEELVAKTRWYVSQLREAAAATDPPPPLEDSPKCRRCSLVGICLPDETRALSGEESDLKPVDVRRLVPGRDDAQPLYLNTQGMSLGKQAGEFVVREKGRPVDRVRMGETSQVCVFGNVQITTQALQECFKRDLPVLFFSYGGWFQGMTTGLGARNVDLRRAQYEHASDKACCLNTARRLVADKIRNCRVLLRRNHRGGCDEILRRLRRHAKEAENAKTMASLL